MLKNIDPLLNADVLYALRAMGHGDELVVDGDAIRRRYRAVDCDRRLPGALHRQGVDGWFGKTVRTLTFCGISRCPAARLAHLEI
jgi:hypothetical protein